MTFSGSVLLVAALGAVSFLFGRLLAGALGIELLRPLDPARGAASAILGMAVATLGFGWLSLLGVPAPRAALALGFLFPVLLAFCVYRRTLGVLWPRGAASAWVGLLASAVTTAVVSLLPVLRTGGFSIGNDTYTYCAFSDWLQAHGFGTPCLWELESPVTSIPYLWQQEGYPLGAAYLLALLRATSLAPLSLVVYPALSAYGMVLQTGAVFLAARWVFRLSPAWAAGASLAFAALAHPAYWGHHNGFLQQTCALPALLLALAVLARNPFRPRRQWGAELLLALLTAYLLNVYLPLVPLLAIGGIVYAGASLERGRRRCQLKPALARLGAVLLLVVVLAFSDLRGVLARLSRFASTNAGGHVSLSALQFLQFAVGAHVLGLHGADVWVPILSDLPQVLAPIGLILTGVGLYSAWRRPRARGVAAAASALVAGLLYYSLAVRDPWSGLRGHTWNVLKLMQWAFPLVLLLQVAALRHLFPPRPGLRGKVPALLLAGCLGSLGVHWAWSESLGLSMREIIRTEKPLAELPALKRRIEELPPGTLLVVGRPVSAHRWLAAYTALLAYPRPIVGDWRESPSVGVFPEGGVEHYADLLRRIGEPGIVPLLAGFIPFQEGGYESLGEGFARLLPSDRPLLIHVMNPGGPAEESRPGRPRFTMGGGRSKLIFYSPLDSGLELQLRVQPYPRVEEGEGLRAFLSPDDFEHRAVRAAAEGKPLSVVPLDGAADLSFAFSVPRGLSTLVLSPPPAVRLTVEEVRIRTRRAP